LIEEPMAAAIGVGLPVSEAAGNLIVDIGGGTCEVALISLAGIVFPKSVRVGGDTMDDCIVQYMRRVYNLLIGERTAEEIKLTVATVSKNGRDTAIEVRGRDMVTGLPTTFSVTSADCRNALEDSVASLIAAVRGVLEKCPPELASDIVDNGIYLTGGGALLDGLAEIMQAETGIDIHIAENPLDCVAVGTGKALQSLDKLHPGTIYTSSNLV
jgi:rod shape-determining protein MreB